MADVIVLDMRSDTLTKPSLAMRRAMAEAEVGDDVYGEDPTINELQKKMAEIFGKEDALFVPSGTMGNLISVMAHCYERGSEVLLGHKSHIFLDEQGGISQVGGVHSFQLRNQPDGTLDLNELETSIRKDDPHYPKTRLICLENSHNVCGGKAVPVSFHKQVRAIADKYGLKIHLDGARLMNAAVALGVTPRDVTEYCDSVSMCFSKGLGAPVGAIIAGTKQYIYRAIRLRKLLGGGLRQAGVLAAPALVSLQDAEERIRRDHKNAQTFNEVFKRFGKQHFKHEDQGITTNILRYNVCGGITSKHFINRLEQFTEEETTSLGFRIKIIGLDMGQKFRLTLHCDQSDEMIEKGLRKLQYVLEEMCQ